MFDSIVDFLNLLIQGLGITLNFLISLLPKSPFQIINNSAIAEYLPTMNFFVPVSEILAIGQAWLVCISLYYLYQIVLRWIKAVE